MKTEHAYWMAAAIDGEGSILIRNRGRGRAGLPRFQVHLVLANQSDRFLEFARTICGCGRVYLGNRAKQLRIERRADAVRILKAIEPYLVIKGSKAREAIAIIEAQPPYISKRIRGRFAQ